MKIILLIYVFALFVILAPNVFISYDKQFGSLLHSTLFIIIFYFTYDGVLKEGFYRKEKELTVNGMGHLADLFGKNREERESNTVIINNEVRKPKRDISGETNADKLLQNSLKKINKLGDDNKYLKNTLDAYKGEDGVVDKLQETHKENKERIKQLQTQVNSLEGNEGSVIKLNGIIKDLQLKNSQLNLQLIKKDSI